ncbi:unnamed protein product [Rotaria socialis]|uniref:Uncharacterized protein n=3 Tax=Rotaria socialis TaxID=392032 RepID=A0A817PGQ2_9BILA|nr:unnamed protein product [Rotaria socialis]CAF3530269.1 unnamed protein product [Rotaria socialis]CAF3718796.1 unnamed protein product [Rotaria socialis]
MSKLLNTRSVRSKYPSILLLIDYGLSEKTMEGICHGLDQLFSIITTYVGLQHIPMFGLIVNGQNQSETFIPLSLACNIHMELQLALYKLQLLAQKWSTKSNGFNSSTLSWQSALQLADIQINSILQDSNENRSSSNLIKHDFQIVMVTNRLSDLILSDIHQYIQNEQFNKRNIELVCVNDGNNVESFKQKISSLDWITIKYILENKYSIGLYLKSWLLNEDRENEHIQLYLPTIKKTEYIDHSWHIIRCDLQELLINPYHHINHDRFLIFTEPSTISTSTQNSSSPSLPIYQFKALNFIKQTDYCISMIFGMPLLVISSACRKYDSESIEQNEIAFDTLTEYLRINKLMLICRLNDCSSSTMNQSFSGHFILSAASERSLILRSIASSELLLPLAKLPSSQIMKHEQKQRDENLFNSLSNINIEDEEYNPLYYEARKSKITLNTNLI